MMLTDALRQAEQTRMRIRRAKWDEQRWFDPHYSDTATMDLRTIDVIADDWEVEERKFILTRSQLRQAVAAACKQLWYADPEAAEVVEKHILDAVGANSSHKEKEEVHSV